MLNPKTSLSAALALALFPAPLFAQASSQDVRLIDGAGAQEIQLADGTLVHRSFGQIRDLQQIPVENSEVVVVKWNEVFDGQSPIARYRIRLADDKPFGRVRDLMPTLHLQRGIFDPGVSSAPAAVEGLEAAGEQYLVQFETQSLEAYRAALTARGATVRHFFPNNAHLVEMTAATASAVENLPFVRWVGPYHASYRLEQELLEGLIFGSLEPSTRVNIQVTEKGPDMKGVVAERVEALGATIEHLIPDGYLFEASLTPTQLRTVVSWDEVLWVDRWSAPEVDMDKVRVDGGANYVESVAGFTGEGVRGECFDTNCISTHPDLQSDPVIFHGPHSGSASHGTSVTGVTFGDGAGLAARKGMLPDGQPIFADFGSYGGNRYAHTAQLLQAPYFAVFQTNSWGSSQVSNYTSASMEMDDILFDNDIVITQSQSNTGNTNSRPQAWAKNIVSVGGIRHQDTQTLTDDAWAGAGSIGPAQDGRLKPDLGFWYDDILTCGSSGGSTSFGGTSAATPMTAGHFGLFFEMWHNGIFGNPTAATVFDSAPKATTSRAFVINGASRYTFSGANADLSHYKQGWGRADVEKMYDDRDDYYWVDETDVLGNMETATYAITVDAGTPELKVTMVYLDRPGTTSSSQHRINDLSLRVTSPGATAVYWGNNGLESGNWSTAGGNSNTKDVIENVFVQNPAAGVWTVEVIADELNQDTHIETPALDADFALVVRGTSGKGGTPCLSPVLYCDGDPNSFTPAGAMVTTSGSTSVSANDLVFSLSGLPPNQFGLFFYGPDQVSLPNGNGTICVGGSLYRLNPVQSGFFGNLSYALDLGSTPPGGSIISGSTWNFQFWYRDPMGSPSTYNFSDAFEITWCD